LSSSADDVDRVHERLRIERDERRRMAELVHDGPVQHVAALAQMLDAATLALESGEAGQAREIVARAAAVAREAGADLRDLVDGIEPPSLHRSGFTAAVSELVERVAFRRGIAADLDLAASTMLGEDARSGLYQIVREALDQAVRRGPPSRIAVVLHATDAGGCVLTISDDGGLERRRAVIDGLAERAADLNGELRAERTGPTTTITVVLPPSGAAR
jgi:signal transduction histidine kinase